MSSLFSNIKMGARLMTCCAAAAGWWVAGCWEEPPSAGSREQPNIRIYAVRGFVRSAPNLADRTITVEHEDIPGFMPAMTMPFAFRDPQQVECLSVGEAVAFKVFVTDNDSWIAEIRPVDPASVKVAAARPIPPPARVERLKVGQPLPDFELIDQSGRPIRRQNFSGKPLLLTFIFTRCPIPNFCPLMSQNFRTLQQAVRADAALAGMNLLSISFDERDTPALLTEYGSRFSDDFESWRFATGLPEEIQKLTHGFAVFVQPDGATINHGLATALVDADGVIRNIWRGNGWRTDDVLVALRSLQSGHSTLTTQS
jgi:protein SCO1